ncbi:carbonic anhydrase [Clostridium sp. 'White wine YQ']|uniref:carbonic anhydrase n=1 Tax=Clostridium sp. 'White wine YQ' TaxID=3027474 RepID=UPI0023660D0E|nr:carbonic anhydrase [Clostridium sp. 'White wine YQ']MDD7793108.1 carbonic anhydrase [Clostridium sp. 'White wine YQ']
MKDMNNVRTGKYYLDKLIEGNERFYHKKNYEEVDISEAMIKSLEEGQNPFATILSCSDSRITPTIIFNQGLGDIFEIRLAGNIISSEALGSIEYGITAVNIPVLMVLGHQGCAAVNFAIKYEKGEGKYQGEIKSILERISPSVKRVKTRVYKDLYQESIIENIGNTLREILKSSIVTDAIKDGRLIVASAIYNFDGKVEILDVIS